MNRRAFLSALVAVPVAHELEPVRRVYSFLWAPDVVTFETGLVSLGGVHRDDYEFRVADFDAYLKQWYTPERVRSLTLDHESGIARMLGKCEATITSVDRERGEFTYGRAR